MSTQSTTHTSAAPELTDRERHLQALEAARGAANAAELQLEAWLDRYPPGDDRPASWHDEHRRLQRETEGAWGSYSELRAGTQ